MIRTVFLGTPPAAVPSFHVVAGTTDLRLVITRPDKPRGRSGRPVASAVKEAAGSIPVAQPSEREELEEILAAQEFDVGVVAAFGMILSPTALAQATRGFLNVHFSLLPRWRGAAPVERAIQAGDEITGVTIIEMDEGLDTGPILASRWVSIDADESAGELTDRLALLGADLLAGHLPAYAAGSRKPIPQHREGITYAPRVEVDEALLSAATPSVALLRAIRAFSPRPGARFRRGDETLKVWRAAPADVEPLPAGQLKLEGKRLLLGTADDPIELQEVQPSGGRRMAGDAWARGRLPDLGRLG